MIERARPQPGREAHRWHRRLDVEVASAPWWAVAAGCAMLPALRLGSGVARRRRRRRSRAPDGRCTRCGYDLRASPGRCPECGAGAGG